MFFVRGNGVFPLVLLLVVSMTIVFFACEQNDQKAVPTAMEEARKIYGARCFPCHGAAGAGDGPASKALTPPPRNFTLADWQSSVDDAFIEKIIGFGGPAVGKSPLMPPNPDLAGKPEVLKALRTHIRGMEK